MAKDALKQWQGKVSRAKGKAFETRIDEAFEYYSQTGYASIEKTPEPMKVIKRLEGGRFIACFEKKAQPDYKGTLKGGRAVMFEAKFTDTEKIDKSRVDKDQTDYLQLQHSLGARVYIILGFSTGNVYRTPWEDWQNMKALFGRKYVKETDLQKYKVPVAWNFKLMLLN